MGADVPDPTTFGTQNVQVDTSTATYRAVKNEAKTHKTTQSKSFQVTLQKLKKKLNSYFAAFGHSLEISLLGR